MDDFFKLVAAIIAANLLTIVFVYAVVTFSRAERENNVKREDALTLIAGTAMTFGFMLYGMYLYLPD